MNDKDIETWRNAQIERNLGLKTKMHTGIRTRKGEVEIVTISTMVAIRAKSQQFPLPAPELFL